MNIYSDDGIHFCSEIQTGVDVLALIHHSYIIHGGLLTLAADATSEMLDSQTVKTAAVRLLMHTCNDQ